MEKGDFKLLILFFRIEQTKRVVLILKTLSFAKSFVYCYEFITYGDGEFLQSEPGVNFNNVLRAAFEHADPKSTKKIYDLTVFLRFWDLRE